MPNYREETGQITAIPVSRLAVKVRCGLQAGTNSQPDLFTIQSAENSCFQVCNGAGGEQSCEIICSLNDLIR